MTETWQTVEQAAVTLGVSVRTINRHITGGKYPSRLVDGRREVLITLPQPAAPVVDEEEPEPHREPVAAPNKAGTNGASGNGTPANATTTAARPQPAAPTAAPAAASYDNVVGQSEMMLAISDNWRDQNELVASAYQTLARNAEQFARSRQRSARVAWSIVGVVTVGVVAAVGWTSYSLTHATVENDILKQQLAQARQDTDKAQDDARKAREDADKAHEHWTSANERTSRVLESAVGGMADQRAHPAPAGPATLAAAPTPATPQPTTPPAPPASSATQPATPAAVTPTVPPPAPPQNPAPGPAASPTAVGAGTGVVAVPGAVAPRPTTLPIAPGAGAPAGRGG